MGHHHSDSDPRPRHSWPQAGQARPGTPDPAAHAGPGQARPIRPGDRGPELSTMPPTMMTRVSVPGGDYECDGGPDLGRRAAAHEVM